MHTLTTRWAFLGAMLAGCGGSSGTTGNQDGGGCTCSGGPYLPQGTALACEGTQKATGLDPETGNLICAEDLNSATAYTAGDGLALDGTTFSVAFSDFACPGSDKLAGFSAGAPMCEPDQQFAPTQVPRANSIVTIDPSNSTGKYTSITIGTDGLPVIAYRDYGASTYDLRVAKCADPACATAPTITAVDGADDVGEYTSIAIGADGFPVISYYDLTNTALKVAKCADAACAAGTSINVVDTGGTDDVGQHTSIAVGTDGLPVISYYNATQQDLDVAHCADAMCTAGTNAIAIVDGVGTIAGEYSSLAIGTDGKPVISYFNSNNRLWVAKCGDLACATGNQLHVVDAGPNVVGRYNSLTIGADGLPVISYRDSSAAGLDLKVVRCADAACTAVASPPTVVDGAGSDVGEYTSITIGADGLPIVAYYDLTGGTLRVAKCGTAGCTSGNTLVTVDSGFVGDHASITIGADGLPVIAYRGNSHLKVAKCANPFCLPFWTRR
jgi:hypothetical protein